jgi:hypothetical protein
MNMCLECNAWRKACIRMFGENAVQIIEREIEKNSSSYSHEKYNIISEEKRIFKSI